MLLSPDLMGATCSRYCVKEPFMEGTLSEHDKDLPQC
jgi:hypothetical protein